MPGFPVVVSEKFGLPVKQVDSGAPVMTVSAYGLGVPIVLSDYGAPFVVEGVDPGVDYVVSSDTQWDAVMAEDAATLAGKVMEVSGSDFTARTITDKDFTSAGGPFTIRSASGGGSIPALYLAGTVDGLNVECDIQMTGWPKDHPSCVKFEGGAFDNIAFRDMLIRHGYGEGLADVDMTADLPEYTRVDNVQTATTTSATYPLSWQDAAATDGWIEFFNRGGQDVYVALGGAAVTATASDQLCPAGQKTRITPVDPTAATHIALLAASGTSEVNARTEIGLVYYQAEAFNRSGSAVIGALVFSGVMLRDVSNGFKGLGDPASLVIDRCDLDRIYQDNATVKGNAVVTRNIFSVPYSRSGIPEGSDGDARDPHGDIVQSQSNGAATQVNFRIGGNVTRRTARRAGVTSQGIFLSDNNIDPSYDRVFVIANAMLGGSVNQLNSGEPGYPLGRMLAYGNTLINPLDLATGDASVRLDTDGNHTVYTGYNIAQNYIADGQPYEQDNNLRLVNTADPAAVFPSVSGLLTADTRAAIETAITTAAEGAGLGAVACKAAIDWETDDLDAVFLWESIPSGAHWNAVIGAAINTLITLPLREILNERTSQEVVPGVNLEWRSVDTDGVTEVQAWTGSAGTIEPGQFIQVRATSATSGLTEANFALTINGFVQDISITTKSDGSEIPTEYLATTGGYLVDPANVPTGTSRIQFSGKFSIPDVSGTFKLFAQSSTGCDLEVFGGLVRVTVEDSTGSKVLTAAEFAGASIAANTWVDLALDVNHATETATLTLDGTPYVLNFAATGTGTFQDTRNISMLAQANGTSIVPSGTEFADLSVSFDGVVHKTISNDAATANADAWQAGLDFTQGNV